MATICLCYAAEDRAEADPLAGFLVASGLRVIHASEVSAEERDKADAIIVVWSRASVQSSQILAAADAAVRLGKLIQTKTKELSPEAVAERFRAQGHALRLEFRSGHLPEPNIAGRLQTSMVRHEGKPVYLIDQMHSSIVNTTDQWVNTTLRRAIRQAAEADADYIAIPSGDTVLSYNPGDESGMRGFYGSVGDASALARYRHEWQDAEARGASEDTLAVIQQKIDAVTPREGIVPKNLRKLLAKLDPATPAPVKVDHLETPTSGMKGKGFTLFHLTDRVKREVVVAGQIMFAVGPGVNRNADTPSRPSSQAHRVRSGAVTKPVDLDDMLARLRVAEQQPPRRPSPKRSMHLQEAIDTVRAIIAEEQLADVGQPTTDSEPPALGRNKGSGHESDHYAR